MPALETIPIQPEICGTQQTADRETVAHRHSHLFGSGCGLFAGINLANFR